MNYNFDNVFTITGEKFDLNNPPKKSRRQIAQQSLRIPDMPLFVSNISRYDDLVCEVRFDNLVYFRDRIEGMPSIGLNEVEEIGEPFKPILESRLCNYELVSFKRGNRIITDFLDGISSEDFDERLFPYSDVEIEFFKLTPKLLDLANRVQTWRR